MSSCDPAPSLLTPTQDNTQTITVSELAGCITGILRDPLLQNLEVRGEVADFKINKNGHYYFSLKDKAAQVGCCVWRSSVARLKFKPKNGDSVVVTGSVDFYAAGGRLNFIVQTLRFDGAGSLFAALEKLKIKLHGEGLFEEARKKPLPRLPRRIAIISSASGAALQDVVVTIRRRWPLASLVLISAQMQGANAAPDVIRALNWSTAVAGLDLTIIARGGGSTEDLWPFNDEALVRAVAAYPYPVISAIGHETDFTLLDFVADLRAPTPTGAGEKATPDQRELCSELSALVTRSAATLRHQMRYATQQLIMLGSRPALSCPVTLVHERQRTLQELQRRSAIHWERELMQRGAELTTVMTRLEALDPRQVLQRGYALVTRHADGAPVTAAAQLRPAERARIVFADGEVPVQVEVPPLQPPIQPSLPL